MKIPFFSYLFLNLKENGSTSKWTRSRVKAKNAKRKKIHDPLEPSSLRISLIFINIKFTIYPFFLLMGLLFMEKLSPLTRIIREKINNPYLKVASLLLAACQAFLITLEICALIPLLISYALIGLHFIYKTLTLQTQLIISKGVWLPKIGYFISFFR